MYDDLVVAYAGTQADASFVKSLLEEDGIEAFLEDEIMGSIYPIATIGGVKVIIRKEDLDKAQSIIREFIPNRNQNDKRI